ncbi:hypothetical protein [Streptomyces sp. G45]|uniref:hypothetical protein n=1 Tax=Streptomyces sp. G45 TaxID=3406627 RepID=UPI003C283466
MTSEQMSEASAARTQVRGTSSLVLGVAAFALIVFPVFAPLPDQTRFLLWGGIAPAGIAAIVCGLIVLHRVQGRPNVDAARARMGIALGIAAIMLLVAVFVWLIWALDQSIS